MTDLLTRLRQPQNFLLILAFTIAGIELSFFIPEVSADTLWNLRAGQDLWQGILPFTEHWSFTAAGEHWPDHELAFQLLLWGLWVLGGETWWVASAFFIALTLGTFYFLLPPKHLTEKFGGRFGIFNFLVVISLALVIGPWITIRPGVVAFFFTALMIRLILINKPLWIPLLTLVWIQFHGSVIQGCVFVGGAMLVNFVFWLRDRKNAEKLKRFQHFLIATMGAGITLFLSPLGFEFVNYALFETSEFRNSFIMEWARLHTNPDHFVKALILLALVIGLAATRLRAFIKTWEGITLLLLIATFFILAQDQLRVLGSFVLLVTPFLILGFGARKPSPLKEWTLPSGFAAVYPILLIVSLVGGSFVGIKANEPAQVFNPFAGEIHEALHSERCFGATWNDYNSGGFLLWYEPDVKVAIDSRYDPYPIELKKAGGVYPLDDPDGDRTTLLNEFLAKYKINCYVNMNAKETAILEERGLAPALKNVWAALFYLEDHQLPVRTADGR